MGDRIRFSTSEPACDRRHFVTEQDVLVVLSRLPMDVRDRLRVVHFNDRSIGARKLGYVNRGRREIALCALPPRVSLTRFLVRGQWPQQFGAVRGAQRPTRAVRRFMLYDVFLHELGHLQIIHEDAGSERRKFAMEPLAQEFAMHWCEALWATPFDHPDPVHNPPTAAELADKEPEISDMLLRIQVHPDDSQLLQNLAKLYVDRRRMDEAKTALERSLALDPDNTWTHLYLGNWFYRVSSFSESLKCFAQAAELMPERGVAYWCLGDAYANLGDSALVGANYQKAVEVQPSDKVAQRSLKTWKRKCAE